jgi:Electron transfer DM13
MSTSRSFLIVGCAVIAAAAWYAFRPERLFINQRVNESFPTAAVAAAAAEPRLAASGEFHGVAHEGRGTASIYTLADGRNVLRFSNFETSNGPDVQVYLGVAADATDSDTVTRAGFYSLGPIRGNIGDQNYDIPADVDLAKYQSVTIWCRRFGVNFATAPLSAH